MSRWTFLLIGFACVTLLACETLSQETSVNPGINDAFRDPNVEDFVDRFEVESRELYARRHQIVEACRIGPGQVVADVGAGTGMFTRLFSDAVGAKGRVIAVDISPKFLDHIADASNREGQRNVDTLLATADSSGLPPASIDVAFICDTYHHFEFPYKTMASIHRALKPGGKVVLVDFRRIPGVSREWVLDHVRAGQEVVEREMVDSGFVKTREVPNLLEENYFVVFEKAPAKSEAATNERPPTGMRGRGRGPRNDMRADRDVFHSLLSHHEQIRRTVNNTEHGVETLTESDDPDVVRMIQAHVAAMHRRVEDGRGLRYWDELFAEIFRHHASIELEVENTERGVRVVETSDDPAVVALIQAHAAVVSQFVARGLDEAHRNHAVPAAATSTTAVDAESTD